MNFCEEKTASTAWRRSGPMARYSRAKSRFGTFTAVSFPFPTSVMLAPRLFRHSHGYILHPSEGWGVFAAFKAVGRVTRVNFLQQHLSGVWLSAQFCSYCKPLEHFSITQF